MRMFTLEDVMRAAAAFKELRNLDLEDARRYRVVRDRCSDAEAHRCMTRTIRECVRAARVWQRQMLSAQKQIRRALAQRRSAVTLAVRGLAALRNDGRLAP